MFTIHFWKDTAERVIVTAAQAVLLVLGADQFNALEVDWLTAGGFALGGAALALLKALAGVMLTGEDNASLVHLDDYAGKHRA